MPSPPAKVYRARAVDQGNAIMQKRGCCSRGADYSTRSRVCEPLQLTRWTAIATLTRSGHGLLFGLLLRLLLAWSALTITHFTVN